MKIDVLKRTKNELKIEVEGEGHTFCNVVQRALLKDKRVDLAGYRISHPLTENPVVYVRTKSRSKPKDVLRSAVQTAQRDTKAFATAFTKALKESQS